MSTGIWDNVRRWRESAREPPYNNNWASSLSDVKKTDVALHLIYYYPRQHAHKFGCYIQPFYSVRVGGDTFANAYFGLP